jgi:hypothetical protein
MSDDKPTHTAVELRSQANKWDKDYKPGHMLRAGADAIERVAVLEKALLKLANACDVVGVKYFDGDNECDKVDEMITATLAARAALEK